MYSASLLGELYRYLIQVYTPSRFYCGSYISDYPRMPGYIGIHSNQDPERAQTNYQLPLNRSEANRQFTRRMPITHNMHSRFPANNSPFTLIQDPIRADPQNNADSALC